MFQCVRLELIKVEGKASELTWVAIIFHLFFLSLQC